MLKKTTDRIYRHLPWFLWRRYAWLDQSGETQKYYAPFWRLHEKQRIEQFSEFVSWTR